MSSRKPSTSITHFTEQNKNLFLRSYKMDEEKIYKVVRATGAWDLAIGIATIILGLGAGIMLVVSGAKLLSSRSKIMF